jgi:hypothetical protein
MSNPHQVLADHRAELFSKLVASGMSCGMAYLKAVNPKTTRASAHSSGSRWKHKPLIAARIKRIQNDLLPDDIVRPVATPCNQVSTGPKSPREALLARLWQAVNSDTNPDAIAAVKQLRDWIESDERAAQASSVADPAIIAGHILAVSGDYAALDAPGRADYCRRIVAAIESIGLPWADIQAAMTDSINRDFAPPLQQMPDSIDSNKPTPPDAPPISSPDVILS